jgi:hypothetical protein
MTDASKEEPETIRVRLRLCVYKNHLGNYDYYVNDYDELSADTHAVWLEADVPIRPTPIKATVLA